MKLRPIWNECWSNLFSDVSRRPRRHRIFGALEPLESRINLSAVLVVETAKAYWVIEDSHFGGTATHSDNENQDSESADPLPNAETALVMSPGGGLAFAEKEAQPDVVVSNDATTNTADATASKTTANAAETNSLLLQLLVDTGISTNEVISVKLLPNVSLADLIQSENDDSGDSDGDSPTASSPDHTPRNAASADHVTTGNVSPTTAATTANSVPVRADTPNVPATNTPQETAAAASTVVAWLRTYFQEAKTKSAGDADQQEGSGAAEDLRAVALNVAFPNAAAVNTVVANVDRLFAKFQRELADDTGSVSAPRYVRSGFETNDAEAGSDGIASDGVNFNLSYAQWASLASAVGLATGALAKKTPRESRDEARLRPFVARSETKLRACQTIDAQASGAASAQWH